MMTATQKEDRKTAWAAFQRVLKCIANNHGQAHARTIDDAADYGLMAGLKVTRIVAKMADAGINPDDAAIAVLHSPQRTQ